jgi:hypothetical protein
MSIRVILAITVSAGHLAASPADDYVNFIRQTQVDSGVDWDVTVAPSGESLSQEGVGPEGSFFQLWSIHNATTTEYMLDEQYVSSYLPTAKITILTGDPYTSVKRTRVDQSYSVTVTVSGLDDGTSGTPPEEIPEAAKKIAFEHVVRNYDPTTHGLPENPPAPTVVEDSFIDVNGDSVTVYSITHVTGPDLTQAEGEEVFTATALEDFGTTASTLDSQRLQVWPIATGSLSGIDTEVRYVEIPTIFVVLHDLYPKSETYVRAYRGAPSSNPVDPFLIPASYVKIADSIPRNRDLALNSVDELFKKEGPYTLEIIHETPFGYDILDQLYPLKIDRTIEVKVNLFTGE